MAQLEHIEAIEKRLWNNTFAEFFRETAGIGIYAPKYDVNGDSKAKRLSAFLEVEPDALLKPANIRPKSACRC